MDFNSIDELGKAIQKAVNAANGEISLAELFSDRFMKEHSKCNSFDEFCEIGGVPTDIEAFAEFPDKKMDDAIRELTQFGTWKEMQIEAAKYRVLKEIDKIGYY